MQQADRAGSGAPSVGEPPLGRAPGPPGDEATYPSAGPTADPSAGPEAEPAVDDADRHTALLLAVALLATGFLATVAPLLGVASTADGSAIGFVLPAAAVSLLPGLLALALATGRPALGLAATAGAGVLALPRLLADLALVVELDGVVRPELFYETTDRARPFTVGPGGWALLVAHAVAVGVGLAASAGLGRRLGVGVRGPDDLFTTARAPVDVTAARAAAGPTDSAATDSAATVPTAQVTRSNLNSPMLCVGFAGVLGLVIGALEIPYSGGYLGLRILPLGASVPGVIAAAALALVAGLTVIAAAAVPRQVAIGLLAGAATAAAVPPLTAVVAVLAGAPTMLSWSVAWELAGAAVLAGSAALASPPAPVDRVDPAPSAAPTSSARWGAAAAVSALIAAALAGVASRLAVMLIDGTQPVGITAELLAPASTPFLLAAVPVLLAAAVALLPATRRAGWAAVAVVPAGLVLALAGALAARSVVVASATNPLNVELPDELRHTWTAGPGLWLGGAATALGVAAATLAVGAARRATDESPDVPDDDSLRGSRTPRRWAAGGLTVLTLAALTLPVYTSAGVTASVTLWTGFSLDSWGVWAVGLAAVGAAWAGAATRYPASAAAAPMAAATVVAQRMLLPGSLTDQPGFQHGPGFWAGWLLTGSLVVAGAAFAALAARVVIEPARWELVAGTDRRLKKVGGG